MSAIVREPQEREAFRLSLSPRLPMAAREPAELDPPRFLGVELPPQRRQARAKIREKPLGFRPLLEPYHPVSSAGESHPDALSEPYLNVSAHTAPARELRRTPICQCANSFGSRREMRATQCVALRKCRRSFLYFR